MSDEKIITDEFYNSSLYRMLIRMANFYEIKLKFDTKKIKNELEKYENDWKKYNPRKNII